MGVIVKDMSAAEMAFWELHADDGTGLRTSTGLLFNHTVFARDVAMIARWILPLGKDYHAISREVILTLCWHQGVENNRRAEEQPGRIHNEYRKFAVWQAPAPMKLAGRLVSLLWGGDWQEYTSYVAVDTTPLFVQLVCAYATQVDRDILDAVVLRHDGQQANVGQCLDEAMAWMVKQRDNTGLMAVKRTNPLSLNFQIWKDSHTALVHGNGRLATLSRPIAYLDTQFLVVDALRAAADLLEAKNEVLAGEWRQIARELVATTLERFWEPGQKRFYVALEHNRRGEWQPVTTPGSNVGWMLDSTFFDGLAAEVYIEAIARQLFGANFLTPAGVRCRAIGSDDWLKVADYHGSWAVWPVDSYVFARGLRRQGLPELAADLEQRLLRSVELAGSFYEYFLVTPNNQVLYKPHHLVIRGERKKYRKLPKVRVQILPERELAWTISACMLLQKGRAFTAPTAKWAQELQYELAPQLISLDTVAIEPPFIPATYLGAVRVARVSLGQWLREYIFRL